MRQRLQKRQRDVERDHSLNKHLSMVVTPQESVVFEASNVTGYDLQRPDSMGVQPSRFNQPYTKMGSQAGQVVSRKGGGRVIVPKIKASERRFYDLNGGTKVETATVGHRLTAKKHRVVITKASWQGVYAR